MLQFFNDLCILVCMGYFLVYCFRYRLVSFVFWLKGNLGGLILMGLVVAILGLSPDFALAAASYLKGALVLLEQTAAFSC